MELIELVRALRDYEALDAREWVLDARCAGLDVGSLEAPSGLTAAEQALAASVVELLAELWGQKAPAWTASVRPAPTPVYLVRAAEQMPRLRKMCETEGSESFRKRDLYAPPDFLTSA